jgi:CubicO group peptidase (beta-lactamase class C family)
MMREIRCAMVVLLTLGWLLVAQTTAQTTAPRTAPSDLAARLDAIVLDQQPNADEPGLAVLVVVDGRPVLRKGYGLANVETRAPIAPDMIFRIGSVTKQFTAVAVLQLVQQGKVRLDDPITKYVSDLDTRGQTITIEHLLTHTSGIPSYTAIPNFEEVRVRKMSPRQIVALVDDQPLEFAPGSQHKYSNTGYILLGMVIEKASGQSYADYMLEHVFKPAGMKDTRYGGNDFPTDRHARGYEASSQSGFKVASPLDMSQPFAAGAIESTVDDLWSWTRSLGEGKLVDPKLLERAWTPYKPTDGKSNYGYGWEIARERDVPNERWIRHGGGINGFQSYVVWIPERKVFVAVLSNAMGGRHNPGQLSRQLALEALGRPTKQRVAITLDEATLDKYPGVYEISPRFKLTVTRQGNRLFIQGTNQPNTEVFAEAQGKFFAKVVDAQFEFHVEGDRATSLTLYQNGRQVDARRVAE